MNRRKKILLAPLDWGIGHASRCIPVIEALTALGHEVLLASSGKAGDLLQLTFPQLPYFDSPAYGVQYPAKGNLMLQLAKQAPGIHAAIQQEHKWLQAFAQKQAIDAVISDNRYGLFHAAIPCAIISHQLTVQTPFLQGAVNYYLHRYLKKFRAIWIPDTPAQTLSGELSNSSYRYKHIDFIGPLSRFQEMKKTSTILQFDYAAIVSGPEPQRSLFEKKILEQVKKNPAIRLVLLRGLADTPLEIPEELAWIYTHLPGPEFYNLLMQCRYVLARPGYSTIMDLACIGKQALLVPTPGQTEQEYLARWHHAQKHFICQQQDELNLQEAREKMQEYKGIVLQTENTLLSVLENFLA